MASKWFPCFFFFCLSWPILYPTASVPLKKKIKIQYLSKASLPHFGIQFKVFILAYTKSYIICPQTSLASPSFSPLCTTLASWLFSGDVGQVSASRSFCASVGSLWWHALLPIMKPAWLASSFHSGLSSERSPYPQSKQQLSLLSILFLCFLQYTCFYTLYLFYITYYNRVIQK